MNVVETKLDRNTSTIFRRIFSFTYINLIYKIIFSQEKMLWFWGYDVCIPGTLITLFMSKRIVWDILDLPAALTRENVFGRLLRALENLLIKRVNLLLISSEGFWRRFYLGRIERSKVILVENRVSGRKEFSSTICRTAPIDCVKVVYAGIFRSERLLRLILEVCGQNEVNIEFYLYGMIDKTISAKIIDPLREQKKIHLFGRYNSDDLSSIYSDAHLVFGLSDIENGLNESILLTNRMYHAGAFSCPIVVTENTFQAEYAAENNLGWAITNSSQAFVELVCDLLSENGTMYQALASVMPTADKFFLEHNFENTANVIRRVYNATGS